MKSTNATTPLNTSIHYVYLNVICVIYGVHFMYAWQVADEEHKRHDTEAEVEALKKQLAALQLKIASGEVCNFYAIFMYLLLRAEERV